MTPSAGEMNSPHPAFWRWASRAATALLLLTSLAAGCGAAAQPSPDALAELDGGAPPRDGTTSPGDGAAPDLSPDLAAPDGGASPLDAALAEVRDASSDDADCVPRAQQVGYGGCAVRACDSDGQWGAWHLAPGAACATDGARARCARAACPLDAWQTCSACHFGPCRCDP